MNRRSLLALTVLAALGSALSGCLASDDGDVQSQPSESASPTAENPSPSVAPGFSPRPSPTQEPTGEDPDPPVASFAVSGENVTEEDAQSGSVFSAPAESEVVFDASESSDPAGGDLAYAWDFGDGNAAEGVQANHSFAEAGNFTVVLTVTSSASGASSEANATIVVEAAEGPEEPVEAGPPGFDDPEMDGVPPTADITRVEITDDGTIINVAVTLFAVQPAYDVYTATCINVFLNDSRYELYSAAGAYSVYSYGDGGDVSGASAGVDGDTVTISLPMEGIGLELPVEMHVDTRTFECLALGGQQTLDRAPDSGEFTYEGS
jgi:PKD repeat protein